jgi:outer membrane protein OmpA-like peptidoglycan-associated protein
VHRCWFDFPDSVRVFLYFPGVRLLSSQDNEQDIRVVAVVLTAAILLGVELALGLAISKARSGSTRTAPLVAAPAATAPPIGGDASVLVKSGVVKFCFASGNADLPSGALAALGDSVAAAQAGKRRVICGFHDATGDAAFNAELAKRRAFAVRDTLVGVGVVSSSIELKESEQTTGSHSDAEARRAEATITDQLPLCRRTKKPGLTGLFCVCCGAWWLRETAPAAAARCGPAGGGRGSRTPRRCRW